MENNSRDGFGSNFGFIMAAVGSAVGLGNIWGFPFKMGMNGGFAFLLVYLVLAIFVGLAVMVGELAIGRKTGMSPIAAYRKMSEKCAWVGVIAVIVPALVLCFYFVLGGMVMRYALGYLTALFGWNTWGVADIGDFFGKFICSGGSMLAWTAIFIALNAIIVMAGVGGGIEKFCNIGMPCLFVMLIVIIIYVAVQPGAGEGYKFMFGAANAGLLKTNFFGVLKTAAGQVFFSLSLGMGAMITYGSYLNKKEKLQSNAVIICIMDTLVAIMAGMIVMPACYAFGVDTGSGPGLLFKSMQVVFFNMGGIGNLMGFMFYFLVFIAAISSSMSLLEAITSAKVDSNVAKGEAPNRKAATLLFAFIILIFCIPTALDGLGSSIAGGAEMNAPCAMLGIEASGWSDCWLDFYDMISEGVLMPFGAMVMAILIGWVWGIDPIVEEAEQCGHKFWGKGFFKVCYKFITPVGMAFVLLAQVNDFFGLGIF